MYVCMYIYIYIHICEAYANSLGVWGGAPGSYSKEAPTSGYYCYYYYYYYTRSPLEDSRLFGPSPWKVLAATYEKKDY